MSDGNTKIEAVSAQPVVLSPEQQIAKAKDYIGTILARLSPLLTDAQAVKSKQDDERARIKNVFASIDSLRAKALSLTEQIPREAALESKLAEELVKMESGYLALRNILISKNLVTSDKA